jgi:hypothetical protein
VKRDGAKKVVRDSFDCDDGNRIEIAVQIGTARSAYRDGSKGK